MQRGRVWGSWTEWARTAGRTAAQVAVVAALTVASPAAAQGGGTGSYQAHQIGETNGISIITLAGSYDTTLSGGGNADPRYAVAQEFYRTHPDDFDFLVVFPDFSYQSDDGIAFHWGVRNAIQGLGMAPFDYGSLYGSPSKLLGFIDMPALGAIVTDPTQPGFEFTLNILAHEVLHQWGVHSHLLDANGNPTNELIGQQQAHWSYLVDTSASVEYGSKWQDNGNGTFTATAVRRFYSPLDLYLAGFYEASEVPPFLVITSPGTDPTQLPQLGATVSGTGRMVTVDQIVAADGPRVPAAAQSQHSFKAAFIYLMRPGDVATDAQLAAIATVRNEWMTHFSVLTGGRGTFEVTSEPLPPAPGAPTPVGGGTLRPTAASLPAAYSWLRSQQTAGGYWQDTPGTRPRDTAVVLPVLLSQDPLFTPASQQLAAAWLAAQIAGSNDDLARLSAAQGSAPLAAQLAAQVNADGGWGLAAGYSSDPLDTALAAQVLGGQPATPPAILAGAARFLIANQGADGGWASVPGGPSRVGPTAAALEALKALGAATVNPAVVARAFSWLAARQNADGGFGDTLSTSHDTAAAILASVDLGSSNALNLATAAAYLGSHQATTGSWEGSSWTTATVLSALARFSYPNWAFGSPLVATPAQPNDGDKVTLAVTVVSNGNSAAPAGVLRVYDGNPAAGGRAIGPDVAIPPLPPGQSAVLTAVWDTLGLAGSHTLVAVIDPDNQVTEVSKADNQTSLAITVGPAPVGIDLTVNGADITVNPAHPASLPSQLAVSAIVRNAGQTDAPTVDVRLYANAPGATPVAVGDVVLDVPNRSSSVANFLYTLTTPGTTVLTVVADPDNLLGDVDRSNNSASTTVTTAAAIDLAVAPADIVLTSPAYQAQKATFQVTLHNLGTVDAPTVQVKYTVSNGTTTETLPTGEVTLAAGASVQDSVIWTVDMTGSLTFTASIDPSGVVQDADRSNNQASLAFTATAIQQADVTVGRGDLTVAPNPGLEGQPFTATAVVHNSGGQDVQNLQVAFYDGDPAQGAPLLGTLQVIPDLAAGSTATVSATETVSGPGNHLIYVVVDPNAQQSNLFSRAALSTFIVVPVLSLPDAAISQASLVLVPAFPAPGLPVTLSITVQNLGQQPIANLLVAAWDGDPAQGGTAVGTATIALLPAGGNAVATIGWTLAAGASSRTLYVVVDPNNAVVESNKANNQATLPITVTQGDFVVSNRYFSPNGDGVLDTTEFDFRLSGTMTVAIQVLNANGTVVRTAAGSSYTNVAGGSFVWDGRDDRGIVVGDGDYTLQVVAAGGAVQGHAIATVDTNRSPLLAALGTQYAAINNLSCPLQPLDYPLQWSPDEQALFFFQYNEPSFPQWATGVYRMTPQGGGIQQLVPAAFFGANAPVQLVTSPDGSTIAFESAPPDGSAGDLWTVGTGGNAAPVHLNGPGGLITFTADGASVVLFDLATNNVVAVPVAGGTPRLLLAGVPNLLWNFVQVSPDRQLAMLPQDDPNSSSGFDWTMLDLVNGGLTGGGTPLFLDGVTWSPDSSQAAGSQSSSQSVVLIGRDGTVRQTVTMPQETPPEAPALPQFAGPLAARFVNVPQWSWAGDALATVATYEEGCYQWSTVYTVDLGTGLLTAAVRNPGFGTFFCISFHVSTWDGHDWVERGVLHHSPDLGERELDLGRFLPDPAGTYRVRIRQVGGGASRVAAVSLGADKLRLRPSAAHRLDNGADLAAALAGAARGAQPIDFHDAEMEVSWQRVPHHRQLRLLLDAAEGDAAAVRVPAPPSAAGAPPSAASAAPSAAPRPATRQAAARGSAASLRDGAAQLTLFNLSVFWAPYQYGLAINGELGGVEGAYFVDVSNLAGPGAAATAAAGAGGSGTAATVATPVAILPNLPGLDITGFSPYGRYMQFQYNDQGTQGGCVEPGRFTWSFSSLMNLTADLRLRQVPGEPGYLAEGSAVDLNFARYQFDYANTAAPSSWTPLGPPVATPVIGGQFTTWAPPGPGTWQLRLTAQDLAGNSATSVQQVISNVSPTISNIALTPAYISPNGDGVQDTADIHFQVLQPVHLDFHFLDFHGNLVRTISTDQAEAAAVDLTWDGRDDSGQVVPDGVYTMEVLGYTFPITVVDTPPQIVLQVGGSLDCTPPTSPLDPPGGTGFAPVLEAGAISQVPSGQAKPAVVQVPILSQTLETGAGPNPFTWTPIAGGSLTAAQYVNMSFRYRVTDAAGNTAEKVIAPGAQQVFLSGLQTKTIDPTTGKLVPFPGSCASQIVSNLPRALTRVQITETVVAPIVAVYLDTQPLTLVNGLADYASLQANGWAPEQIATFFPPGSSAGQAAVPDFRFELDWDLGNLTPGVTTALRVRLVDSAGNVYTSSPLIQVSGDGIAYQPYIGVSDASASPQVAGLIQTAGLQPPADPVITATAIYPGPMSAMTLTVTSTQDPHYATPRTFNAVASDGSNFVFTSPDWQPCTQYFLHFVAQAVPQVDPLSGAVVAPTLVVDGVIAGGSCTEVRAGVVPLASVAACGDRLPTTRQIVMTPQSFDGTPLALLTLSGPGGQVFSVNAPLSGTPYYYNFDTAQLPPGTTTYTALLTNTKGQTGQTEVQVGVVNTPPVVAITSPQSGQTVCGVPTVDPVAGIISVVHILGTISNYSSFGVFTNGVALGSSPGGLNLPGTGTGPVDGQCSPFIGKGAGVLANLCSVSGQFTVQVAAANDGGYTACTSSTFTVDAKVDSPQITVAPQVFSPNNDGVLDTTGAGLTAGEATHVGLAVYPATLDSNGNCVPTGNALRQLGSGIAVAQSPVVETWDGKDDNGLVVPDGLYELVARYTDDSCGNVAQVASCATVDDTPPQLAIDFPQPTDPLPLVIQVKGMVTDLNPGSWVLDYAAVSAPDNFAAIATGTGNVVHDYLGSWNTFGLSGGYLLRLRSTDAAGNSAQLVVPLTITNAVNLITAVAAQPHLFSPNGDGRLDTAAITFGLGVPAAVTLTIQDASGATVRTLLNAAIEPAGAGAVSWDGATDGGQPAADGTYTVTLAAAATANPAFTESQSVSVVLDRTPPAVTVTRPANGGYVTPTGQIVGSITDAHLASWSVSITATPQTPVWTQLASGTTNVTAAVLGSLVGLAEGSYALKVDAADAGQIQVEQIIPFTVDSTPPAVTLTAPAAGSVVGAVGGAVGITGSVVEAHIQSWQVQLGAGAQPASWTPLGGGTTLPLPQPALAWTPSGVPDGPYQLRLYAQDLAGQTGQAQVAVTIDNTPPVVAITVPADGGYVTGPLDVFGTAEDANLLQYTLAVAPGAKGASQQFSTVGVGASPVNASLLAPWTALPPDGVATLRLTAVDKAGNQSTAAVQVTVHTQPPAAPQGLAAQVNQQTVELSWLASPGPGSGAPGADSVAIAGYRIYRNGVLLNQQQLVAALTYNDTAVPQGTYAYTVVAVDQSGLASAPSAPADATVDLSLPVALISKPRNGGRTGGLVSIIGTASKTTGFKQYSVYALPNDGSGSQQLLRTAPVPVLGAELAEWNTAGIADGSSFTLKLVVEDVSGNTATAQVTVTTDNTPPAAPTGLTATPSGSDIQVTWNANTESDLAGYLLYRNGKLANASGTVVGDLTPYLLTSPSYDDQALPDGTFTYIVYAVDTAGNLSAPSQPAQATLDNHAPHVVITQPAAGTAFQTSLQIVGTTADLDVASVQFQWQPAGASGWNNLGAAVTSPPWETVWDGTTVAYGNYMIQAVATDTGGRTDPAPTPVPVTHRNTETPPAPTALTAQVAGGSVTLAWTPGAPVPADLAGYLIDRTAADGTVTHVVATPLPASAYTDSGVADGTYGYTVTALNQAGNASTPAGPVQAVVYTPLLVQPYTPTSASATALAGANAAATAQVGGSVALTGGGSTPLAPVTADAAGNFSFAAVPLGRGDNLIGVQATDAAGNLSKTASVPVLSAAPPSMPTGLVATPGSGLTAQLSWNANPAADNVLGYRLLRDGGPAVAPVPVDTPWTATASSPAAGQPNDASQAIDGDETTYWVPQYGNDSDLRNQWLEVDWPVARLVAEVQLDWAASGGTPVDAGDFDIQGWDGRVWVPLAAVRGDAAATTTVALSAPYLTQKLRLQLVATSFQGWLAEIRIDQHPLIAGTSATDATTNGNHSYQVIAVDQLGLPSQPSAAASVGVGDVTPPQPVTLSGAAIGTDVGLTWTASATPGIAGYLVLREGAQIAQVVAGTTAYTDAGRPNGTWHYSVEVEDALGNISAPSNTVAVTIAVTGPGAPSGLAVTPVATGGALQLVWAAGSPAGTAFQVERGTVSGGPYAPVATVPVSAGGAAPSYTDSGLTNGTRYYYVVVAVDGSGNASAPSNEANGVPADTTPPAAPVLTFPAVSTLTFATADDNADLAGSAEPGSTVAVKPAAGGAVESTQALAAPAVTDAAGLAAATLPLPSPDGRYLLLPAASGPAAAATLYDFDAAGGPASAALPVSAGAESLAWMADGRGLLLAVSGVGGAVLESYRFAGAATATLATLDWADGLAAAPDNDRVAVLGSQGGQAGLWVVDPAAASWSLVAAIDPTQVVPGTLVWSPEGSWLAYVGPAPDGAAGTGGASGATGVVVVQVAAPNAAALVEASPGSGRPSFAPDGSAVAYTEAQTAAPAGGEKVRLTTLPSGATVDLTDIEAGPMLPQLSPDGGSLAWMAAGGLVAGPVTPYVAGGAPPAAATLSALGGQAASAEDLAWVPGGYLLAAAGDEFRVAPAGRFAVPGVPLALGDNSFTATARDAAGNLSTVSAPRVVHRTAANLPDLAIAAADLALLPVAPLPGQAVRVTATVHNQGPAASPATTIALTAYGPGGVQAALATALAVPAIVPGGSAVVAQDGVIPGPAGAWTLVAQVDPQQQVQELTRTNDQAQIAFQVVNQGPPVLSVATDQAIYPAGATLTATLTVFNGSDPFSGQLLVTIEDTQGTAVTTLPAIPTGTLAYGQQLSQTATWNTGDTFAGAYQVDVKLQDGGGQTVAEATAPFAIAAAEQLTAAVATDSASYVAGAGVHITATVGYPAGNAPLSGVSVHIQVLGPVATGGGSGGGTPPVAGDWTQVLGTLLPGGQGTVAVDWATGGAAPGAYQVTAAVQSGGQTAASAATQISLTSAAAAVTGTLTLADRAPSWGQPVAASYTLHNGGTAALTQLPVRVRVLDATSGQELARQAATIDLAAGGSVAGSASFDSKALGLGSRLAVLEADLPAAGGGVQTVTLALSGFTVYDRTAPTVAITQPAGGATESGAFTVVATATDPLSTIASVSLSVDGGAATPMSIQNPATASWSASLSGLASGAHTLQVQATDAAGNTGSSATVTFSVATAPPVIAITGVAQGGLYNAPVTPVVTVTASTATFSASITLDGQPFTSGTPVAAEGNHTLAVTATDAAGNTANASVGFTIDKTPPVISITGVSAGGIYNAAVTPVVTVTDAHPGTQTITLNGQPFTSGTAVAADGSYTLAVAATDAAGNTANASVSFVIDKSAPTITITGVAQGGLYNVSVTPVVTVSDAQPGTQTTITLNGAAFTSGTAVTAEGSYTLAVTATDVAGNTAHASVGFAIDKTPPAITITGVAQGGLYNASVTPVVTVTDAHPGTQTVTLDGQPFTSGTAVAAQGSHTLAVSATDAAGNTASASVAFAIDTTPPVISITGVSDGGSYTSPVTPVVTVTDAHPGTQTVTLNGQPFSSGTTVSAAGSYTLAVSATDAAGNTAQASASFSIVAAAATLAIADVTVTQPASGAVAAQFPVTLSAPASGTVSVGYSTAAGSAIGGLDFLPVGGVLSFAPGVTAQTVSVPVLGGAQLSGDATFTVQLAQPQGAALARATASGTIVPVGACTSANLLANPSAEQPAVSSLIPGWDVVAGTAWQVGGGTPQPFDGDGDFSTSDAAGELKQDVDLLAYAAQIQGAAGQSFAFSGQLRTVNAGGGAAVSTARIVVEYRDQTDQNVLSTFDSGLIASAGAWTQVADQRAAPAGTRFVRVRLLSGLPAGGGGQALFDGLSLTSVATPALAALDAAAATPAAGQQQALAARVVLSCAATQTVTVHYATVDDTAVAGTDYQAASGTLVFSPGSVEQDVPLVALGLGSDQVDREFDLVLTAPANANLARAQAVVRLLPRPFCAQPPSYWRHHPESWTLTSVTLGGTGYSQTAALWLLQYGGSDPLYLLAQQLAAVRLDLAAGASTAGQTAAANADSFLAQHALGSTLSSGDAQTAANLTSALVSYDSATCPLVCSAEPLGVVGRFNVFVLGNLTQSGTDTAGRLAAAGNVTLSSYSVGQSLTATGGTDDVLVAGGALSWNGGTVSHGNAAYGGSLSLTSVNIPNGTARQDQPIDFAGASRNLGILSSYWASLAANGTTTVQPWKQINLVGSDPTLNVFTVHGSDLAVAVGLAIQVPSGSTALVNIDGTSDRMQNFGFQLSGVANGGVALNFYQATTLSLSGIGVPATVLAPKAAVSFSNGNVNGTLVGASVSGGGQFNQDLFTGCLPVGH